MIITQYKTKLENSGLAVVEPVAQYESDCEKVLNTSNARHVFKDVLELHKEADEHLAVLCLNASGRIIGLFVVTSGAIDACAFPAREIARKALMLNARSVIVAHNHPGGNAVPSNEDIEATKKLKATLDVVDLKLIDHIIVAGPYGDCVSLREEGYDLF